MTTFNLHTGTVAINVAKETDELGDVTYTITLWNCPEQEYTKENSMTGVELDESILTDKTQLRTKDLILFQTLIMGLSPHSWRRMLDLVI